MVAVSRQQSGCSLLGVCVWDNGCRDFRPDAVTEPIDLNERRKEKAKAISQWFCAECGFGQFHLFDSGQAICANCETESANLVVNEVLPAA